MLIFRQTGFLSANIRVVMTEPAVPSARILGLGVGLGLKLYPSIKQRMLNKDLTLFMQQGSYSFKLLKFQDFP